MRDKIGKYTFLDEARDFVGYIGRHVFLWSIRMTNHQYLKSLGLDFAELEKENQKLRDWICATNAWRTENYDTGQPCSICNRVHNSSGCHSGMPGTRL